MLKLTDLRKTTRRAGDGDLRVVYPRFLRDRSLAPRLDLAVRYLEKMLGHARREMEQEVIVQLFGDHKLARCIVACLAATYRYRARAFAEVVAPEVVAHLAEQGISSPIDLRLWLYRRANVALTGFVGGEERAPFLVAAGEALGLAPEQIETLISLDDPAQAILTRVGPLPTAEDVRARFNYETAAALLANASTVRVSLTRALRDTAALTELAQTLGVPLGLSSREIVFHGRQDALNNWTRHGARLVRLLSALLVAGGPARKGEALIAAPDGRQWVFRFDAEILGFLGLREQTGPASLDLRALANALSQTERLMSEFSALRRAGAADGWTMRRATEPVVLAEGVAPALLFCARGEQRVAIVLAPPAGPPTDGSDLLAAVAQRLPLLQVCLNDGAEQPDTSGAPLFTYAARGDLAALPSRLNQVAAQAERVSDAARVVALFDEARAAGVLTETTLADRLHCSEDDVAERLALPALRAARQARQIQYVEGFGLCTGAVLTRARAAAADVANLGERADGTARVMRVLGRRLREVTGASEGIECLIAYLGAA